VTYCIKWEVIGIGASKMKVSAIELEPFSLHSHKSRIFAGVGVNAWKTIGCGDQKASCKQLACQEVHLGTCKVG
jgi:hypothetical protein